jgi:purine-binding chemotaxis protein CheW
MTQAATACTGSRLQVAVFRVGKYVCGLMIERVQEINRSLRLRPVHEAPAYVRGIINLRGNIVTVIDLRKKLGLVPEPLSPRSRNVIVKQDREMVGLLVDSVDDIVELDADTIAPTPAHLARELGDAFEGVAPLGDELLALLQLEHLLSDASP